MVFRGRGRQWSTGTPATQVGNAAFGASATYNVGLDRNELTRNIAVNAGNVTLNLNGYTLGTLIESTIASGATLKVGGSGVATISSDVTNSGTLAPGTSIGALNINGEYVQTASGKLQIEIASLSDFDRLNVGGNAGLDGTLEVLLVGGYMPPGGYSFNILDWGSRSGSFASLVLPEIATGEWDTSYLYNSGVLAVALPGDFNFNGTVDAADYVVLRNDPNRTQTQYYRWREFRPLH